MFKRLNIGLLLTKSKTSLENSFFEVQRYLWGIKGGFVSLKIGIRNLILYFPVIWQDRDYDQFFFHKLLKFKIDKMIKHFEEEEYIDPSCKTPIIANLKDIQRGLVGLVEGHDVLEYYPEVCKVLEKESFSISDLNDWFNNFNSVYYSEINEIEQEKEDENLDLVYLTLRKNVKTFWS